MSKVIVLKEKWVIKYAQIKNIDEHIMLGLFKEGVLSVPGIKAELIKHDLSTILDTTTLNKLQAKQLLSQEYEISIAHIDTVIYKKPITKLKNCTQCGAGMTRYKFTANNGLCDKCLIKDAGVEF